MTKISFCLEKTMPTSGGKKTKTRIVKHITEDMTRSRKERRNKPHSVTLVGNIPGKPSQLTLEGESMLAPKQLGKPCRIRDTGCCFTKAFKGGKFSPKLTYFVLKKNS